MGRLKPDVMVQQAQTELNLISQQATTQLKDPVTAASLEIHPLHQQLVVGVRLTLLVLWGAVALVMLLACANVANLMLARTVSRQREMAIRAAVGARRWQLIRQLLGESIDPRNPWWSTGVAVGCVGRERDCVSRAGRIRQFGSQPEWDSSRLARVWFHVGDLAVDGPRLWNFPALSGSRPNLLKVLRESSSRNLMSFGLRSMRGWLVVTELALALILLLGAGLLVRSFRQLTAVDLGFNRENVLMARLSACRVRCIAPSPRLQLFINNCSSA